MNALYISYNAVTEPITQSQVIPYLKGLAGKGIKFYLMTFEKSVLAAGEKERIRLSLAEKRPGCSGIEWFGLRYHKSPTVPATLFDVATGLLYSIYIILKYRIDVVHARAIVAALIGCPASKILSKKFIFDTRGIDSEEYVDGGLWKRGGIKHRIVSFLEGVVTRSSDHVVVLTDRFRKVLQERYRAHKLDFSVIPCAVDMNKFHKTEKIDTALARQMMLEGKFIFVYSGSIGTWYMLREMLDFFKCAARTKKNAHFLILTQSDRAMVLDAVREAGLDERSVTVRGASHDEMPGYTALGNVGVFFIKPVFSKQSSSPTKFAEYLASGLPVVINGGIGDTEEMVRDNAVGVIVENFSDKGYNIALGKMAELLEDERLSERCTDTAARQLSLEKAVEKYHEIYAKL